MVFACACAYERLFASACVLIFVLSIIHNHRIHVYFSFSSFTRTARIAQFVECRSTNPKVVVSIPVLVAKMRLNSASSKEVASLHLSEIKCCWFDLFVKQQLEY